MVYEGAPPSRVSEACSTIGGVILPAVPVLSTRQTARSSTSCILMKALDAAVGTDDPRDYREVTR